MLSFNRHILYLAIVFAYPQTLAAPLALPLIENVSEESEAGLTSSPTLDAVFQATQIYSSRPDSPVLLSPLPSGYHPAARDSSNAGWSSDASASSASAVALPRESTLNPPDLELARAAQSPQFVDAKSSLTQAVDRRQVNMFRNSSSPSVTSASGAASTAASEDVFGTLGDRLNSAIREVASALDSETPSLAKPTLSTSISVAASPSPTINALTVLLSALPESVAAPIRSDFNEVVGIAPAASSTEIVDSSTTTSASTRPDKQPNETQRHHLTNHSGRPTGGPTDHRPTNSHHDRPTHRPSPHTTFHTTSSTSVSIPSSTTASSTQTNTLTGAQETGNTNGNSIGANPISNASIAGLASGIGAAAVIGALAGIYIWRRKKGGQNRFSMFGRANSQNSGQVYPEVAWLYDPKPSAPGSPEPGHSRDGSGAEERLIPDPRAGSMEVVGMPARPSSPWLAPHLPPSREQSPGGSPSRSLGGSRDFSSDNVRLLRPIHEE